MGTGKIVRATCDRLASHLKVLEKYFLSGNGNEIEVKWQPNKPTDTNEKTCNYSYLNYKYLSTIADRCDIENQPVYMHPLERVEM